LSYTGEEVKGGLEGSRVRASRGIGIGRSGVLCSDH
jgi:hypothetical protein